MIRCQIMDRDRNGPGSKLWAIAEGYIPEQNRPVGDPAFVSHETACILNASDKDASVEIVVFFEDREPIGPYRIVVPARRTRHVRFNDLKTPEPIPRGTDYASLIASDVPVVVQHTRLDSREPNVALLSTIAYPIRQG